MNLPNTMFGIAEFNTSDFGSGWPIDPGNEVDGKNQTLCYYKGLNEDWETGYTRRQSWWNVFAAKLGFVLAFQVSSEYPNVEFDYFVLF